MIGTPCCANSSISSTSATTSTFIAAPFGVRGDVVEVFPTYEESRAVRIEFFGDSVEAVAEIDPLRGQGACGGWTKP